jgi:CMP-N-acetylneuraminic acid synthetase
MKTIVVIPARGGSKGIPRKNLRPLAGRPMIYYSIKACLSADPVDRVVVSTDDEEIALFAERFGAEVLLRPEELADDVTTLDPVIACAVEQAEEKWKERYDLVLTVQPTSPLITAHEVIAAVTALKSGSIDTVLSVVDDRHLCWTIKNGVPKPLYDARVNRQQLPPSFKETGAVIACTREQLNLGTRIGENVHLLEVPHDRSFDIDTFADLALCESLLKRKRVVFAVVGYDKVGLGHVYRTLMLAHELVHYDICFVCEKSSDLAAEHIRSRNYTVHVCDDGGLAEACIALTPDLIINDILDTDAEYINQLKSAGIKVVNFEDMGSGYAAADLVINALYPHQLPSDHVLVGPKYFCLRDEFLYLPKHEARDSVERMLLTFGGVDEGNLTVRCLELLGAYCKENNIGIDVVTGPGFNHKQELSDCIAGLDVTVSMGTRRISDFMCQADLAITSGGRTVLELAALQVPTIVICQNRREITHTFASSDNGILNLGYRGDVHDEEITSAVIKVIENQELLKIMRDKAGRQELRKGKKRVIKRIIELLQN